MTGARITNKMEAGIVKFLEFGCCSSIRGQVPTRKGKIAIVENARSLRLRQLEVGESLLDALDLRIKFQKERLGLTVKTDKKTE